MKTAGNVVGIERAGARANDGAPPMTRDEAVSAADEAVGTIAPLWPLESFVAVNPFLGISSVPYTDADNTVSRIWGARLTMPRAFYARAICEKRLCHRHIVEALAGFDGAATRQYDADRIVELAFTEEPESQPAPTIASLLTTASGHEWTELVLDRISFWAASYFDEGQAGWQSPWRDQPPFAAWRGEAELDRTPEIMGVPGFRGIVRGLPADVNALLHYAALRLGLRGEAFITYQRRLLATIAGWAGHVRYRGWHKELVGRSDERVKALLAIRMAWDLALLEAFEADHPGLEEALRQGLMTPLHPDAAESHTVSLVLQAAFEIASREPLLQKLTEHARAAAEPQPQPTETMRPVAQAVFCIDVRSERYRRALECTDAGIETLGFAGFFGFALEVAQIDRAAGGAQCPVLLQPQFLVRETAAGASEGEIERLKHDTWLGRRLAAAKKQFSAAAISSFAFVESLGLAFAWKLLADTLGIGRRGGQRRLVPTARASEVDGRAAGIALADRIAAAAGALKGMSLVDGFAPVVALVGHGATTANNPYATRFNCGACGGHTGEANALVAAEALNDPDVRAALLIDGIDVPTDTLFVAGLHDTTTDEVRLLMPGGVPASHRDRVARLQQSFDRAGAVARHERAKTFGLSGDAAADSLVRRSTDWSQVRPEWGLAGCMAFIAAPRERTRGVDLGGRAFLHSYDHDLDEDHGVLELIMTAPMVVATWINLQYYASTVDNEVFGSGDKTLHNVVGGFGVLEGNGGDLRVGLPWQSLHDGMREIHEPQRLNVFLEAPVEAISAVLGKHAPVRELADNGWIHLFALRDGGRTIFRYDPTDGWVGTARADVSGREAATSRIRRQA